MRVYGAHCTSDDCECERAYDNVRVQQRIDLRRAWYNTGNLPPSWASLGFHTLGKRLRAALPSSLGFHNEGRSCESGSTSGAASRPAKFQQSPGLLMS
jgi:hypothetical protein